MSALDAISVHAERLLALLAEEASLLDGPFDPKKHDMVAEEKAERAEGLEAALEAVKGEGRSALAAVPADARQHLATQLDTLQMAMTENEAALRRHADLSRGILQAIEAEACRAAGPVLATYGAAPAPVRRAASLAVNADV
ncbi:MAG: hypothetical protein WA979_07390 [Pacificimonas sp.]